MSTQIAMAALLPVETKTVNVLNMDGFTARIEQLNRRAKRLNVPGITFTVLSKQVERLKKYVLDDFHQATLVGTENVETTTVQVECPWEAIRLPGWAFIAKLTPFESGNIVCGTPLHECPPQYRAAVIECQHCKTNRRRNDSFVLLNRDSGEYRQIGRSCLVDYIGSESAGRAAQQFEFFASVYSVIRDYADGERENWEGESVQKAFDCAEAIAKGLNVDGGQYISRKKAEDDYTGRTFPTGEKVVAHWKDIKPTDEEKEKADEIVEFLLESLPPAGGSTYEYNLRLILTAGYCTRKTIGIAVSAIAAYTRAKTIRAEREATVPSAHIGTIGERRAVEGILVREWAVTGDYGTTMKCQLRTDAGEIVIANNLPGEIGQRIGFTGTVKYHNEFRGVLQTVFARPSKARVIATEEAAS